MQKTQPPESDWIYWFWPSQDEEFVEGIMIMMEKGLIETPSDEDYMTEQNERHLEQVQDAFYNWMGIHPDHRCDFGCNRKIHLHIR